MQINYTKGDATDLHGDGIKFLIHICNDSGGWGRGFVLAVSNRWPQPEALFRKCYADKAGCFLGDIQIQYIRDLNNPNNHINVVNMVAQHGYISPSTPVPLDYDALQTCLTKIQKFIKHNGSAISIHAPKIGAGLGGGDWNTIENMLIKTFIDEEIPVTIYTI